MGLSVRTYSFFGQGVGESPSLYPIRDDLQGYSGAWGWPDFLDREEPPPFLNPGACKQDLTHSRYPPFVPSEDCASTQLRLNAVGCSILVILDIGVPSNLYLLH